MARQTGLEKGNSVMALVGGGGYAGQIQYYQSLVEIVSLVIICIPEYCAVPYQTVVKIPSGLTYTDAAGLS